VAAPNTFAGEALDRAASRRTDDDWLAQRLADPTSRAVLVGSAGVLVAEGGHRSAPAEPPLTALGGVREAILLGVDAAGAVFAVDLDALEGPPPPGEVRGLREIVGDLTQAEGGLLAHASALTHWHRSHRFCARCGAATAMAEAGYVRRCPACGAEHHPRTDPVVIMLVTDGDRALVGRQAAWPEGRYSALAGFVEPGESLEEAVAREVAEEAGVSVSAARYRSSQPWPFPASLMIGFHADYAGGEPAARDGELEDVRWSTRQELEAARRGQGDLLLPPPDAIARRLIDDWLDRTET
jgi:NAD+ diphosphatase